MNSDLSSSSRDSYAGTARHGGAVSTLTYRSIAATKPSLAEMETLLAQARTRNRALGVTGMLLFAGNEYFQWLEGPPDGLNQIWEGIRNDPRHARIEIVERAPGPARLFGDWDMKFVCRDEELALIRDRDAGREPLPARLTDAFASLAMAGDVAALCGGIEELILMGHDLLGLHGALIEPAARRLGALWRDDRASSADISLGLNYLQAAVRRVGAGRPEAGEARSAGRRVLVAPQPGEPHGLGASLAGDTFRRSGWRVDVDFPGSDQDLEAMVGSRWYDALSLSLSDVFSRLERLPTMAQTVRAARRGSLNPGLVIVVGGLAFRTQPWLTDIVGADAGYASCAEAAAITLGQFASKSAVDSAFH
jgi:methanogenic corrinoid protein MtbC1